MSRARPLLALIFILMLLSPVFPAQGGFDASESTQTAEPRQKAQALLARLTPEEKVGQLFLITFDGTDVAAGTQINDLITKHFIGGVALTAENDNFTGDNTVQNAHALTGTLQQAAWDFHQGNLDTAADASESNYIPLFVGVSQDGDLYPGDEIISGLSPLPSLMSVGATWKPDLARQVGAVLGKELSSLGFNLYLGPSLDVLEDVPMQGSEDLGTRSFGGDPFWVGVLGQAYIQGVHEGSAGQMAVIAKHFPGRGSSDRPSEEEVATVRKSLEQLQQIELAPFFSVTGNAPDAQKSADGLLVSHIRYQGFQSNIRATTSPVSFDRAALEMILKLPAFASWREMGGVMVSDDLGSPALRRFYQSTGQAFDARQVARNAFQAGNDLLYLNNFWNEGDTDEYTTILRTLTLFVAKYREDRAFAERVDASVERILTMKYRLYPNFQIDDVRTPVEETAELGAAQRIAFDVAREAATLISPNAADLDTVLPRPPGINDRLVFITDASGGRQCSRCLEQVTLAKDALQNAVLQLYGPQAGGQVYTSSLASYSFTELHNMLNGTGDTAALDRDLRQAGWIIFGAQNIDSGRSESQVLRRFLSERPDLYRNKRVIAFAFNAPYYLDATDIARLTAYYGLYSKSAAFVDTAARILFQELTPGGHLPVSVPGVGYDMILATSPDPAQVIPLFLDVNESPTPVATQQTPMPTPVPVFKVGDPLPLRTGEILDHNGNLVPDGTVVRFLFALGGNTGTVQQAETTTTAGIARTVYNIQTPGMLEIRAVSDPATASQILRLDVSEAGGVITAIAPTSMPTETPAPTETPEPTATPTPTPTILPPARPGMSDWSMSILLIWGGGVLAFLLGWQLLSLHWGLRFGLAASIGGLLVYLYFAFQRLVNEGAARSVSTSTILFGTLTGITAGILIAMGWKRWFARRIRQSDRQPTGPKSPTG